MQATSPQARPVLASKTSSLLADGGYTIEKEGAAWRLLRTLEPAMVGVPSSSTKRPVHVGRAPLCETQRVAVSPFVFEQKTFSGLLDISHAAASPSDLAFCSARCRVYILHQGFCDT